jgi:crotonobetainyl-CoA:carnitine CoA-transferase CaiB-like acyl-CoA transferase
VNRLEEYDVPVAPVKNTLEVSDDPHLEANNGLVEVNSVVGKETQVKVPSTPIRSSRFNPPKPRDPPGLGESTEEVLKNIGYSRAEIQELKEKGAVK